MVEGPRVLPSQASILFSEYSPLDGSHFFVPPFLFNQPSHTGLSTQWHRLQSAVALF